MYPIHLEHQYESYWRTRFNEFSEKVNKAIFARMEQEEKRVSADVADARFDAAGDLLSFLDDLKSRYGNVIATKKITSEIALHFNLIDEWSRARTTEALGKLYGRLNAPQPPATTGRPSPTGSPGELWLTTVNLGRSLTEGVIDRTIQSNVNLIRTLQQEYLSDVGDVIRQGVKSGMGFQSMRDEIVERTGVNQSKAKFWARDQVSKFFGDVTRERQTAAGIPGYIWRTLPGARDSHAALEGTYHAWNNPPKIYRHAKGGLALARLHPGQDYNCRCWAEPALGAEMAEREYAGPGEFSEQLSAEHYQATAGLTPTQWSATGGLQKRMVIDIKNRTLRSSLDDALAAVDRVMSIPAGNTRALTIGEMSSTDPFFAPDLHGYYYRQSGHLALNPAASYPRSTSIHEVFHWVHEKIIPRSAGSNFQRVLSAIQDSSYFRGLAYLKKSIRDRAIRSQLSYLMSPHELFARAMEQYMATKGADVAMSNEFALKKAAMEFYYWIDDDFAPIYLEIESLFTSLGWLR